MWAAARGHINTIKFLIEKGANIDHHDSEGLNAFDVAVIKQIYTTALVLYRDHGMRPKSVEFYKEHCVSKHFDFDLLFQYLEEGRPEANNQDFFARAKKEHEEFMKKDLVVDPRETWTDVFKRIRDFEDPKMIPREELPEEHHPHSSFYNKMVNWSNGIDPKKPQ